MKKVITLLLAAGLVIGAASAANAVAGSRHRASRADTLQVTHSTCHQPEMHCLTQEVLGWVPAG